MGQNLMVICGIYQKLLKNSDFAFDSFYKLSQLVLRLHLIPVVFLGVNSHWALV